MTSNLRSVLKRLRELCERGATLRAAAAELGRPFSTLRDWAERRGFPRRRRKIVAGKEKQLMRQLDRDQSLRTIAKLVGVSKSTVGRRRRARIDRGGPPDSPKRTQAWRCPGCGALLEISRCLACRQEKP